MKKNKIINHDKANDTLKHRMQIKK